jgi:hypothetical protein
MVIEVQPTDSVDLRVAIRWETGKERRNETSAARVATWVARTAGELVIVAVSAISVAELVIAVV